MKMMMKMGFVMVVGVVLIVMVFLVNVVDIEVKMLNKGVKGMMVFEFDFVKVVLGDMIYFVVIDKGYDVESIEGMVLEGVMFFVGEMGKDVIVKFDKEGFYGVCCKLYFGMGMVMLVEVGKGVNVDVVKVVKMLLKVK